MDNENLQATSGLFGIKEDYNDLELSLDARFIKNKVSTFFFEASGSAMFPLIFSGDVLVVDRSLPMKKGSLAIVAVDGKMMCRRVFDEGVGVRLQSENKNYQDILIDENREFLYFGGVSAIVREPK